MELWFFYACIASFSIGIHGYIMKQMADKKIEGAVMTLFQGGIYFLFGGIYSLSTGTRIYLPEYQSLIFYSVTIAVLLFLSMRIRLHVLRYLSNSEFFIGYRILMSFFLLIFGIIVFWEVISSIQVLSLILGSVAIIFLFEEDISLRTSRNWRMALMLLVLSVCLGAGIQIIGKIQGISHIPFPILFFYQGMTMLFLSAMVDAKKIQNICYASYPCIRQSILYSLLVGMLVYVSASTNVLAYAVGGSVSIVTKIIAFSVFVPILVALFLREEKLTYKKMIAFVLTIMSLYGMM